MSQLSFLFPTEAEVAYMAGIVDGEGSIVIFPYYAAPHQRNDVRYLRWKTEVCVSNTSEDLMKWIVARFGGKYHPVKRTRDDWKQGYHWGRGYKSAAQIVRLILPRLVIKRRQAELLLDFQATVTRSGGKNGLPIEVQMQRIAIADEMRTIVNRKRGEPIYAMAVRRRIKAYEESDNQKTA